MMDEFDESVGEEAAESRGSKLGLGVLMIGIAGIVLGITGIMMANQAQKSLKTLEANLQARPDKTPEMEKALESMEERLVKLGGEFVKLGRADRQLQENTQKAFDAVLGDVKTNREGINDVTEKMTELVDKLENWKPSTTAARRVATPAETAGDGAEAAVAEGGVHIVRSGDTLSKIAVEYGVTLSEIQAANPRVNPRALQIGQKIVIPGN
ncbi:LysM peptidoglycan-binding domain-containing protein [Puniceicoccales bacterium CK1056]|uniref:LysM peptidoglycan-binding domain-containing protein n=1 Tax=Oceanipulchritudo coccoides TaxID=2706888 RepID=A0A6B2LYY2_9BACT|nr:LysM peptidoglycan-binding domain-containing protein [Oceanipulchritudo coccoides]NDV60977.1 LysM peptidoglycan-binding domain-containing protein [Oceanipulchritudo coccoides]